MQFLLIADFQADALSHNPPDNLEDLIRQETAHAKKNYMDGLFRQLWFQVPGPGAVALIEANSLEAATAIVDSAPLARFLQRRIVQLAPYPGFADVEISA